MLDEPANDLRMWTGTRRARELLRAALGSALKRSSHDVADAADVTHALEWAHTAALRGAVSPEALARAVRALAHDDGSHPPVDGDARDVIRAWLDGHAVTSIALRPTSRALSDEETRVSRTRRRIAIIAAGRAVLLDSG